MSNNVIRNVINNRDAIRRIMRKDSDGTMDKMVKNRLKEGTLVYNEDGATYTPSTTPQNPQMISEGAISPQRLQTSRMPKAIVESFASNPIKDAPLPEGCGGSVLDGIDFSQIQESQQPREIQPTQTSGIDYSLIKTIVNEAVEEKVKKYVSALAKKLINEGVGGQKMSSMIMVGDKFKFCDEAGNVYEANLKFKKNIKDKLHD